MYRDGSYARLHILAFALALGIIGGLWLFLLALSAMSMGWGTPAIHELGIFYAGYKATWLGAVVGFIWGFVDSFIGGAIFALLYNAFLCCCAGKCRKDVKNVE